MLPKNPATETVGWILTRIVVPLWILMGVAFKLHSGDPRTLPGIILNTGRDLGIDIGHLLYTLIGLEILAIGVMVLLARFAKPMAIFMLSAFCLILIGEMIAGAESCGCFGGAITIAPWQMFLADGLLLLAVILFPVKVAETAWGLGRAIPTAAAMAVAGMAISFGGAAILHQEIVQERPDVDQNGELDPTINPDPIPLQSQYWTRNLSNWVGKEWREIDIFQMMSRWPSDMDEGTRYVIFYSRTCHHCEEMFHYDIVPFPEVQEKVVAVEIPADRRTMTDEANAWPMPRMDVELLELPLGPDWIIQSPLVIRVEDGVITCAFEGDHVECMDV